MKVVPFVNDEGMFIEDMLMEDEFIGVEKTGTGFLIGTSIPTGLYRPRWDFKAREWVEGLTEQEIKAITQTDTRSEIDKIRQEMAEQNAAMWDFILTGGAS